MSTLFDNTYDNKHILDRLQLRTATSGEHGQSVQITSANFVRFHRHKFRGDMTDTVFRFEIALTRNLLTISTSTSIWCFGQGWKPVDEVHGGAAIWSIISEWHRGEGRGFAGDSDILGEQLAEAAGVLFDDACMIFGKA